MDQFIQQDPFGSDQDEWDWSDLLLGWLTPDADRLYMPRFVNSSENELWYSAAPNKSLTVGEALAGVKDKEIVGVTISI